MGALGRASCGVRREAPPRAERAMRQTRALRRRSHCMPFMLWSRCVGGHPFGESSRWPWPVRSRQFWMGFPMWRVPMRRFVAGSQCGGLWRVPMRRFVAGSQCGGLWRVPNAAVCGGFQCGGLWRVPMRRFVAGSTQGGASRRTPREALPRAHIQTTLRASGCRVEQATSERILAEQILAAILKDGTTVARRTRVRGELAAR